MEGVSNLGESSQSSLVSDSSTLHVIPPNCTFCNTFLEPGHREAIIGICRHCQRRLSPIINQARQNNPMALELDYQTTNPLNFLVSGSERVFSDTESGGFDDSLYGFRRYSEADDTVSYGVDSDASIDGQSFSENENLDIGSDTENIDSTNAVDGQWGEAGTERTIRSLLLSPGVEQFPLRRVQAHTSDFFTNFQDPNEDSDDYLDDDAIGFVNFLVGMENSRRVLPPASASYVNNIPSMIIDEENESLACAICKELLTVGVLVNQLPCFHLYHPCCILPWLSTRNTCPLCRYELPTDDMDYEERERRTRGNVSYENTQSGGDGSFLSDAVVVDEQTTQRELVSANSGDRVIPGRGWWFLAAPIVSVVGISILLWFGISSSSDRRGPSRE